MREFLYVDDCADACVHLMKNYAGFEHINVGSDDELTILDLARAVSHAVGFTGEIICDPRKPDGPPES